ncbi:MAG TPA: histidinol-phosphate transaminase [Desulfopila sp.]|nr:histidinol-phosphate transaminase [Desulfopila sp.]
MSDKETAMSRYWSEKVRNLRPYTPGEQPKVEGLIKLNTNENPYGPSPRALKAMQGQAASSLGLYPDPECLELKEAIGRYYGQPTSRVFVGNGSDEVLAHAFQALLQQSRPILCPDISYSFYPVYCRLYGVDCIQIPLADNFEIQLEKYARENGGILFANPNAPTGCCLELGQIDALLRGNRDSVVIIDEAYIDFGGESAVGLIDQYDNLLVVQTLSKSRALAGLRVGFALGREELVEGLERVKNSFNSYPLDKFAIAGGAASMADRNHFEEMCGKIVATRKYLSTELGVRGFDVLPSLANFVFARHRHYDAVALSQALRQKNILVRHFRQPRIDQYLRISIGTDDQCRMLLQALDAIVG